MTSTQSTRFSEDNEALSFARYYRCGRYPVIPPHVTLLAYKPLIDAQLERLNLSFPQAFALRRMLRPLLCYMLALPAAITHHHRTSGGLFYHSLETAAFAAERVTSDEKLEASDAMTMAAFVAGLLHDIGKITVFYKVTKLDMWEQDAGFGELDYRPPERETWDPLAGSLWHWCEAVNATHLAIEYTGTNTKNGHEQARVELWRKFLNPKVIEFIAKDSEAIASLKGYLDRKHFDTPFVGCIKAADRDSVDRDLNPLRRWEPKRSDLHVVRRFIEFASLCDWNDQNAPFIVGNVWIDGKDTGEQSTFFRASWENIQKFRDYLFSEDMLGASIPSRDQLTWICQALEHHGVLDRAIPMVPTTAQNAFSTKQMPTFLAELRFLTDERNSFTDQPLANFPLGERLAWRKKSSVRVILS